jgi:hypothetical protein
MAYMWLISQCALKRNINKHIQHIQMSRKYREWPNLTNAEVSMKIAEKTKCLTK